MVTQELRHTLPEQHNETEVTAPQTAVRLAAAIATLVEQAERAHANFFTKWVLKPGIKRKHDQGLEALLSQVVTLDQELATTEPGEATMIALSRLLYDLRYLYIHEARPIRQTTNVDQVYEAVANTLVRHFDRLQAMTNHDQPELQKRAFSIMATLLEIEQLRVNEAMVPETSQRGQTILKSVQADIPRYAANIDTALEDTTNRTDRLPAYTPLFKIALRYLPAQERTLLDARLGHSFMATPDNDLTWIVGEYIGRHAASYKGADAISMTTEQRADHVVIDNILQATGYSAEEAYRLVQSWFVSAPLDSQASYVSWHLRAMRALEEQQPGICKELTTDFGIRCFNRYKTKTLVQQASERGNKDRFGVCCAAIYDHNGSIQQSVGSSATKIVEQLAIQSGRLVIIEAGSKLELLRRLGRLTVRHGSPAQFLCLDAHSDKNTLVFGRRSWANSQLDTADLTSRAKANADQVLDPNGQVIIIGCQAGQANGIAEQASKEFKRPVIASRLYNSGINKVVARYNAVKDNYEFTVDFFTSRRVEDNDEGSSRATTYRP